MTVTRASCKSSGGGAYLPGLSSKRRENVGLIGILCVVVALVATIGVVERAFLFKSCFGVLLSIFAIIQLYVSATLFANRNCSLLELSQPFGLTLFSLSGSIATAGAFLLAFPEYDISCALRQPIILLSISFMGSILVARSWRIARILSPKISLASSTLTTNRTIIEKVQLARLKVMGVLTKVSLWMLFLSSSGEFKVAPVSQQRNSIVQKVTFADSMRVTVALIVPQLILQIINASILPLRMQSIDIGDGIHACQCSVGPLPLILGIAIASVPFFLALLLNVKSEGMPDLFREFDQIESSFKRTICVLSITLPTAAMIAQTMPNAHAYLLVSSLLSFVLPLCYEIAWLRVCSIRGEKIAMAQNVLRSQRRSYARSDDLSDDLETLQLAQDATIMGNMFETMGNLVKSITVNDGVLSMFKEHEEYNCEDGFTHAEISLFGPKTLHQVVTTLISSAKRWGSLTQTCKGEEYQRAVQKQIKSLLDAILIFEKAPSKHRLKDRSVIFQGYSFMSLIISTGAAIDTPGNQSTADFQNGIAKSFAQVTQFQLYHYCRALAMRAVLLARNRQFNDAIAVVNEMKLFYDPSIHSAAIADEYAEDHSANTIAASALWLHYLNFTEAALAVCDDFIGRILPEVGKTNVDNKNLLGLNRAIMPIIQVIRSQENGNVRARDLYNTFVVEPYNSGSNRDRESFGKQIIR